MSRPIVHYRGKFFVWSSVVDAPVSQAMTREEFEADYLEQYGSVGLKELPERLDRAVKFGTSYHNPMSAEALISGNRAGKGERELSFDGVLKLVGIVTDSQKQDDK